jgi:hypothetical protein
MNNCKKIFEELKMSNMFWMLIILSLFSNVNSITIGKIENNIMIGTILSNVLLPSGLCKAEQSDQNTRWTQWSRRRI